MTSQSLLAVLLALAALAIGTIGGWLVAAVAGFVLRRTTGVTPAARAALLAQARLMPLLLPALLVPAQIIAFARFEVSRDESAGPLLLTLGALGALFAVDAAISVARSWRLTRRTLSAWQPGAVRMSIDRWRFGSAWRIERRFPVVAVVGLVRPQLFVATQVARVCTRDELSAIVAHEAAHVAARDNWLRLLFAVTPAATTAAPIAEPLERAWATAAEHAADARARRTVSGVDLASALTKVARLAEAVTPEYVPASALIGGAALESRVRRLLAPAGNRSESLFLRWWPALATALVALALQSSGAQAVLHEAFELLVRT
jgi:Zn-dependent protease with chaperone function